MDAGEGEAKFGKEYSSGPSSDKSAVCWHYSYDSRIHFSVVCKYVISTMASFHSFHI